MPISSTPGTYNWTWYAGQTLDQTFTVTSGTAVVDLTGYTAAMKARTDYTAGSAAIALGTAEITLGGTAGTIRVQQTAAQTATIGSAAGYATVNYVYDLELTSSGGEVTRLLQGVLTIAPEATR